MQPVAVMEQRKRYSSAMGSPGTDWQGVGWVIQVETEDVKKGDEGHLRDRGWVRLGICWY